MTRKEIEDTQRRVGAVPDGYWGPKSQAALRAHVKRLYPSPHPFPKPDDASMRKFYGPEGTASTSPPMRRVIVPFRMYLYDIDKPVESVMVHEKAADSLEAIFAELLSELGQDFIDGHRVNRFFGTYNPRAMRSGSRPSKHAWGAAIDLDANRNGLGTHWPTVATMPLRVIEIFAKHGWINLGAVIGRDAMHFQATQE